MGEVRHRLAHAPERERDSLLGKILREARDTDVWHFTVRDCVLIGQTHSGKTLGTGSLLRFLGPFGDTRT